ncbi:arginine N-succinyltransferase [Alteromonas sp. C1M14]|uniref:arginine N-succinyltransferase n=1 Tax=Alteromonas sp. C1M14 TaxID=2841567 RepID=UPI001C09D4E6|nr:arginine N-succinyltransferase [Alteromonas sp. C1M14]MBU2978555.1 arginine N-succinyltransferase [Alteromonas sp. C1M14]
MNKQYNAGWQFNNMVVIRPIIDTDIDALLFIAQQAGSGFTSLPADADYLASKIALAQQSMGSRVKQPDNEHYLFVLEDQHSQRLIGTCGIKACAGASSPLYHFKQCTDVQISQQLQVSRQHPVLHLSTDYSAYSEVGSLYLHPQARQRFLGRLLAQCRYLFMQQHPERFTSNVIAQLRGCCDEQDQSPFWQWMQQHFYHCDFATVDTLTGKGEKQFIAELAPRHPVYVHTLPDAAQAAIGQVHKHTIPARKMLEREGFVFNHYIDLFDAGPSLIAPLQALKSVRNSAQLPCKIVNNNASSPATHTLTNTALAAFRATMGHARVDINNGQVYICEQVARLLQLNSGDPIRFSPLS